MRRLEIVNKNSATCECHIIKDNAEFFAGSSISTIISDYLFNSDSNFIVKSNDKIQFIYTDNNLNIIKESLNNKENLKNINEYIEKHFNIKNKVIKIEFTGDLFIEERFIKYINLILHFEKNSFNIPDYKNIKDYIHNRYFYDYDYTNIYSDINIYISNDKTWVINTKTTLEGDLKPQDVNKISHFTNLTFLNSYSNNKIIFEGNIYENDEDVQWIV